MLALLAYLRAFLRTRHDLGLEILALRQQVAVLKRKHPRPHLHNLDRVFWLALRRFWSGWMEALIVVKPGTVVGWHRAGFRLYWRLRSRGGGRKIGGDVFEIVRRLARENPSWGAPRIHGELLKLGFYISERTVSRYLTRGLPRRGDAAKNWLAFLRNHREAIAAIDFVTVPIGTFRLLYCFFAIDHGRRKILHFNVTAHPTAEWVMQRLRQTFSDSDRHRYVILDRDSKFSAEVIGFLRSSGIKAVRTSVRSPWQNGVAERWVGSARRDCSDHVIALNEAHVRRLAREYVAYYHADRTHDGLGKDTPSGRAIEARPAGADLVSLPRVGGLHHPVGLRVGRGGGAGGLQSVVTAASVAGFAAEESVVTSMAGFAALKSGTASATAGFSAPKSVVTWVAGFAGAGAGWLDPPGGRGSIPAALR